MKANIRTAELGAALKRQRQKRGMSLRQLADLIGVSFSTLSRIERGEGKPDTHNIATVTNWLEKPIGRFLDAADDDALDEPVTYYPHEATPEIVQAHLDRDPSLTDQQKSALGELFRVAYDQLKKPKA